METLSNVLWIGGPAGAGKTTAARQLARRHGLRRYSSDTQTWVHRDRALAAGVKLPDRGPGSRHYDRKPMIVDDLRSLPTGPLVVAEGGTITPAMAGPDGLAVWLIPSKDVQLARLRIRHPEGVPVAYLQSFEQTMMQVVESNVRTIIVDGLTVAETVAEVERVFAPRIAEGPTAEGPEERRALLRAANRALVDQYARPSTRPLMPIELDKVIRTFDCECAAPTCDALVDLAISAAAAAVEEPPPSILAADHH